MTTRRGLLSGGATLVAGEALALTMASTPGFYSLRASAQDVAHDIEVLNDALTLEHLEYTFYHDGIGQFTFGTDPFGNSIDEQLAVIRDHEGAHREMLTQLITDLGGKPVAEGSYDFGYTDAATFLATAAALENTGVSAYDGVGPSITLPELLTVVGSIVAVEARHAAYLNLLTGESPFPSAVETPLTPNEVLEIAGQFIVSEDATPTAQRSPSIRV
jgi:hypothetical protein